MGEWRQEEAWVGRMDRGSMMVYGGKWGKMVNGGMGGKDR